MAEQQGDQQNAVAADETRDCSGPTSPYVKFVSHDKKEFVVDKRHAFMSKTIRAMLTEMFIEYEENEIHFKSISANCLERVCMFLEYKYKYENGEACTLPDDLYKPSSPLEQLIVANFLDL